MSSNDLDGESAFDKVLDAAIEGRAGEKVQRDIARELKERLDNANAQADGLRRTIIELQAKKNAAEAPLVELYAAAEALVDLIKDTANRDGLPAMPAEVRLRAAMKAAATFCEMPF